MSPPARLALTVALARPEDASRGIARLDPADLAALGGETGGLLSITGNRTAYARALPTPPAARGLGLLHIDASIRRNSGLALGEIACVAIGPAPAIAQQLRLSGPVWGSATMLAQALAGVALCQGDHFRLTLADGGEAEFVVESMSPTGPALLGPGTQLRMAAGGVPAEDRVHYEDLGGLSAVVEQVREVVELPLRHRAAFIRLGIAPPRGVLLSGPPGTGKTMIARAVATETKAHFIAVNGPEIVDRHYGGSEEQLRQVFETARKNAPAVIFIDEIDAIAPKREHLSGEKQVERRIVAQLLTLMDGLAGRGEVMVLAATNLPDGIDPALRRPGRFDREIRISPPGRSGRAEILAVHTRAMPLDNDVSVIELAAATHGYVGADIAALCREAAISALRRVGGVTTAWDDDALDNLRVNAADFASAMCGITPTALREAFVDVPDVHWSDVAGLDGLRARLEQAVLLPLARPDLFGALGVRPPRGVLLHGRPGTGKTLLARALATEAHASFMSVRGPELLNEWQGASERALRDLFARARLAAPCILFFDEIDAIAGRRGGGDGATVDRIVAQLLTEMDGITEPAGVLVLGATNRADRIDPALMRPGRFDLIVEVPPPDCAARLAMLHLHTCRMKLAGAVDLPGVARATEGYVGADIAGLCRNAALSAISRTVAQGEAAGLNANDLTVMPDDFESALRYHSEGRP